MQPKRIISLIVTRAEPIEVEHDEQLPLCPFCAGHPRIVKYLADGVLRFRDKFAVQCQYTGSEQGCGAEGQLSAYKHVAIAAWERRISNPRIMSDRKEADEALSALTKMYQAGLPSVLIAMCVMIFIETYFGSWRTFMKYVFSRWWSNLKVSFYLKIPFWMLPEKEKEFLRQTHE